MQLIFVHGSGGTGLVWHYQTNHFPDAVAVTLPGHPDGQPCTSIPDAVAWLRALAQREGWQNLVLVGHSLGGGIALQYALEHPHELRGIVLIGSGGRLRVHPDSLGFLEQAVAQPDTFPAMFDDTWQQVASGFRSELLASALHVGPAAMLADMRACDAFDVMARLPEIQIPVHAIVGTADVMTPPKYSEFMVQALPNAELTIIDGGSHSVFAEFPEQVNAAIAGFVAGLTRE